MKTIEVIRIFYIIYTIYTIFMLAISDYPMIYAMLGLFLIWIIYASLFLGYKSTRMTKGKSCITGNRFLFSGVSGWNNYAYVLNIIICWCCSIASIKFYTGQTVLMVLSSLRNQISIYSQYQRYASEANIGVFSITKIPYILMMAYGTISLFIGVIGICLNGQKVKKIQWVYLVMITLSFIYRGIGRGTNFEIYIIFVLISFCLLSKKKNKIKSQKDKKSIIIVGILGALVIIVFRIVVMARGIVFNNYICPEIDFNSERIVSRLFPDLCNIAISIFSYLGYGIYVIGVAFYEIIFSSIKNLIAFLLPKGFEILNSSTLQTILKSTIDVGVQWVPDCIGLINLLGFPLLIVLAYMSGKFLARTESGYMPQTLAHLVQFAFFFEMLSIPVGKFIINSSSNELFIIYLICWIGKWIFATGYIRL